MTEYLFLIVYFSRLRFILFFLVGLENVINVYFKIFYLNYLLFF